MCLLLVAQLRIAVRGSVSGARSTSRRPNPRREATGSSVSDSVMSIPVTVQVVLGTTTMQVSDLMKMSRGAIVPLANRAASRSTSLSMAAWLRAANWWSWTTSTTRFGVSLTEIVGSRGSGKAG